MRMMTDCAQATSFQHENTTSPDLQVVTSSHITIRPLSSCAEQDGGLSKRRAQLTGGVGMEFCCSRLQPSTGQHSGCRMWRLPQMCGLQRTPGYQRVCDRYLQRIDQSAAPLSNSRHRGSRVSAEQRRLKTLQFDCARPVVRLRMIHSSLMIHIGAYIALCTKAGRTQP